MDVLEQLARVIKRLSAEIDDERHEDAEWRSAWKELNAFLEAGYGFKERRQAAPPELEQDYRNLDADVGLELEEVRRAYLRALRRYHPDRWNANPEKYRIATEVTKRLNASWKNIERWHLRIKAS